MSGYKLELVRRSEALGDSSERVKGERESERERERWRGEPQTAKPVG